MKYLKIYNSKLSNLVLVDNINQISGSIHQATLRGGADTIKMNSFVAQTYIWSILKQLTNRYCVVIDKKITDNIILVEYSKEPKFVGEVKII